MNTYKVVIQYNGALYAGWQIQLDIQTIQGTLNKCLNKIAKTNIAKTIGSGRTDSGVHAFGQVVKIEIPLLIEACSLMKALNSNLPETIRVISCEACSKDFHPIFNAVKKEYIYAFSLEKMKSPFLTDLLVYYPYKEFDLELLRKGCELMVGEHDFCNYFCTGTPTKTTVRTIFKCEVVTESQLGHFSKFSEDLILLKFEGSGFLKQMVRLLVGALWKLAAGSITLQDIENSLKKPLTSKLGPVAPSHGLFLDNVTY